MPGTLPVLLHLTLQLTFGVQSHEPRFAGQEVPWPQGVVRPRSVSPLNTG